MEAQSEGGLHLSFAGFDDDGASLQHINQNALGLALGALSCDIAQ